MEIHTDLSELPWDTAIALGLFDGVHMAHRQVLSSAVAEQAHGLIPCALSFTTRHSRPVSKQGEQDILTQSLRNKRLEALGIRCLLLPDFDDIRSCTPERFVRWVLLGRSRGRFLSCGYDFRFGKNAAGDAELLTRLAAEVNAKTAILPPVIDDGQRVSSTRIRTLLRAGQIEEANRLLCEPYAFDFPVRQGKHLGHKWGFPTVNQEFPDQMLVPFYGVYLSEVSWQGKRYGGVTNIGVKPTIAGERRPLAETHIFGLSAELYGSPLEVRLLRLLRPERKFGSVEELRAAVTADMTKAKRLYGEVQK